MHCLQLKCEIILLVGCVRYKIIHGLPPKRVYLLRAVVLDNLVWVNANAMKWNRTDTECSLRHIFRLLIILLKNRKTSKIYGKCSK